MSITNTKAVMTNAEMQQHLVSLEPLLQSKGLLGYAVARNYRNIRNSCLEYLERFQKSVAEYGEPVLDENGDQTGSVRIDIKSGAAAKFKQSLASFAEIKHEVPICCLPYDEVLSELTGADMLALEFMLVDSAESEDTNITDEIIQRYPNGSTLHQVTVPLPSNK